MADQNVVYVEHKIPMANLTKSWSGAVGTYIARQTKSAGFYAKANAPKPGGPGKGRTKINFATGKLVGGIITNQSRSPSGELEGRVIALPEYALHVHEGTVPHVIRAKKAPFLRFWWHRKGVFMVIKKVRHPGTPSIPFLWKGLKRTFHM